MFNYQQQPFQITIDKSIFTENYIHIELQDEVTHIQGELEFEHLRPIKGNILNPNIMGFFSYIPRMECNHGIISMHHLLKGNVRFETNNNRKVIDFDKGIGYIEKDWGTSFPKEYMWVQTNHFKQEDISLFFTMAEIPFLRTKFRGFICNLVIQDQEYSFATYNKAKLQVRRFSEHDFDVLVSRGNLKLRIKGKLINSQELASPSAGYMTKTIKEGLAGKIKLQLKNNQGEILLNTIGECCGLELMKKKN